MESLKKIEEFRRCYRTGKSYANRYLVLYVCAGPEREGLSEQQNRLGISVSKKVGNSVIRHRITRLIRESYRLNEVKLLQGYDIVVVARANAKGKGYFDICRAFLHLAKLHRIIEEK